MSLCLPLGVLVSLGGLGFWCRGIWIYGDPDQTVVKAIGLILTGLILMSLGGSLIAQWILRSWGALA